MGNGNIFGLVLLNKYLPTPVNLFNQNERNLLKKQLLIIYLYNILINYNKIFNVYFY